MNELPLNAETTNKTLNIIDESTKETRQALDKTGAKGVNKLAQLFWASPIGRKADVYIAERPYKMEIELKELAPQLYKNGLVQVNFAETIRVMYLNAKPVAERLS